MLVKRIFLILGCRRSCTLAQTTGFALPIAIALGLVMIAFAGTSILVAQGDRNNAVQRRATGASLLVSDGAVSRALMELSKPENSMLLVRNYDPIDSKTGKNYLGADGIPNSGDEGSTATDQWTGYDPSGAACFQQLRRGAPNIALTGVMGTDETYRIRAYRYDKQKKLGTLLVEGIYRGQSSLVAVTLSIEPDLDDFPGLATFSFSLPHQGLFALRGRSLLGRNSNAYYPPLTSANPSLTGVSKVGDSTRPDYLTALWSGPSDGSTTDTVEGKLFACDLTPSVPRIPQGTSLGDITKDQTISGSAGGVTYYQVNSISLNKTQTLNVDTTAGSVYLYLMNGEITLRDTAKILNIRTDGQPPRVGDLRIFVMQNWDGIVLYDQSCLQNAFVYSPGDSLVLLTKAAGCPGGMNTNFEGVAWTQTIASAKNNAANRNIIEQEHTALINNTVTSGATSGIAVPDDLTSLADLLEYIDWPARYRYGAIKNWQRVN